MSDDRNHPEQDNQSIDAGRTEATTRGIGTGVHILKLLELAQRPGTFREIIIDDWNAWVKAEREKDPEFTLDLVLFEGRAEEWRATTLWGKPEEYFEYEGLLLDGIDWQDAELWGAHLERADLMQAHLEGADLIDAHLELARLTYAHLEGAKLWNAHLEGAELVNAHLNGAELENAHLERAKLSGAHLEGANLESAHLERAKLRGAHLEGANLENAHLECAKLNGAHLEGANLEYAQLEGAALWGAHLEGAVMVGINFTGAKGLENHSYWNGSDLTGTVFASCNLSGGDFTGAILRKADFTKADVSNIAYNHYAGVWPIRRNLMLGKYLGIRGVDSCYGDPGFRRDALDQDFIDDKFHDCMLWEEQGWIANYKKFRLTESKWLGWLVNPVPVFFRAFRWKEVPGRIFPRFFFFLWGRTDYGRSVLSVACFAAIFIAAFGAAYAFYLLPHQDVALTGELARLPAIPHQEWYAAAMGAATLGLTDLLHPATVLGEAVMFANVLTGFFLFGMMVAVLQNKFARRS